MPARLVDSGQLGFREDSSDVFAAPAPVHLTAVLDGLAENPALPAELVRRLLAYRRGFGREAKQTDPATYLIAEIVATGYHLRSAANR